jgi:hypothetical protein
MQRDSITWFEIPVRDLDRAQRFYEAVLGAPLRRERIADSALAVFPYADDGVSGCLIDGLGPGMPGACGTLVYLDASPSLDAALARVARAGGQVLTPKTALPPGMGFFAHIEDSEGHRVGLHAPA